VEPLTAIAMIAAKYGVSQVVGALAGKDDLGDLASELLGALVASEDQLSEQLAGIGRQLDEVLEQRYSATLGAGLRTLLDAGTATDPHVRAAELTRARDQFRDAGAAARSPIQIAVAERYVALCAIALGRADAARTALGLLDKAAFEALIDALPLVGPKAYDRAREQLRFGSRRKDRIEEQGSEILDAAAHVLTFALDLFEESRTLAEGLGERRQDPDVEVLWLDGFEDDERPARAAQVLVRPAGPGPVRFGPLSVAWGDIRFRLPDGPPPPAISREELMEQLSASSPAAKRMSPGLFDELHRSMSEPPAGVLDLDLTVRAEPALSRPLALTVWSKPEEGDWTVVGNRLLQPGQPEVTIQGPIDARRPLTNAGMLTVWDAVLFLSY